MVMETVILTNESGLHARPAALLLKEVAKYKCKIDLVKNSKSYNAKSLISILSMSAIKGEEVTILAQGEDAVAAVKSIKNLLQGLKD